MAEWKKILYSGSAANLSSLNVDGNVEAGSFTANGDDTILLEVGTPTLTTDIATCMIYCDTESNPTVTNGFAHNLFLSARGRNTTGSGGSIAFGNVNGATNANRAHGAIALKQVGSDSDHAGLAFYTHYASQSYVPMVETMLVDHFNGITLSSPSGTPSQITTNGEDLRLERNWEDGAPTAIQLKDTTIDFYVDSTSIKMQLQSDGDLHVDGDVIAYSSTTSDRKLKDNVQTISNALSKIQALRGVSYVWNAGSRSGQSDIGLIAQEVEKVLPEIVRSKKMPLLDDKEYKTIDYEKIIAVLVESVKELSDKVDHLQAQVDNA